MQAAGTMIKMYLEGPWTLRCQSPKFGAIAPAVTQQSLQNGSKIIAASFQMVANRFQGIDNIQKCITKWADMDTTIFNYHEYLIHRMFNIFEGNLKGLRRGWTFPI